MNRPQKAPWHYLILLILAGETVFILPFVLPRVFRPTVLEVFDLSNTQLGLCFSVYGIVAMASYFFGGALADKYPPRKLIAMALWLTALGGLVSATYPGYAVLKVLYGYWGFTTIFLFWAPMIKATRLWGGEKSQGRAFGYLDGGRGLVGALFGALGVVVFATVIGESTVNAHVQDNRAAFAQVLWISSFLVALVGVLVWFFLRMDREKEVKLILEQISAKEVKQVLRLPAVWLLMVIILCAYVGYKITDVFSLYAAEVMRYDRVASAQVGTFLLFIRPVVGILIGFLADRSKSSLWLTISFAVAGFGAILFMAGWISASTTFFFFTSVMVVAVGVYAARSLYFAVMQEGNIPLALTGTAVGLISLIGYTPDIFAGPAMGYLLDAHPGERGHQLVFLMLASFYLIGGVAAYAYYRIHRK